MKFNRLKRWILRLVAVKTLVLCIWLAALLLVSHTAKAGDAGQRSSQTLDVKSIGTNKDAHVFHLRRNTTRVTIVVEPPPYLPAKAVPESVVAAIERANEIVYPGFHDDPFAVRDLENITLLYENVPLAGTRPLKDVVGEDLFRRYKSFAETCFSTDQKLFTKICSPTVAPPRTSKENVSRLMQVDPVLAAFRVFEYSLGTYGVDPQFWMWESLQRIPRRRDPSLWSMVRRLDVKVKQMPDDAKVALLRNALTNTKWSVELTAALDGAHRAYVGGDFKSAQLKLRQFISLSEGFGFGEENLAKPCGGKDFYDATVVVSLLSLSKCLDTLLDNGYRRDSESKTLFGEQKPKAVIQQKKLLQLPALSLFKKEKHTASSLPLEGARSVVKFLRGAAGQFVITQGRGGYSVFKLEGKPTGMPLPRSMIGPLYIADHRGSDAAASVGIPDNDSVMFFSSHDGRFHKAKLKGNDTIRRVWPIQRSDTPKHAFMLAFGDEPGAKRVVVDSIDDVIETLGYREIHPRFRPSGKTSTYPIISLVGGAPSGSLVPIGDPLACSKPMWTPTGVRCDAYASKGRGTIGDRIGQWRIENNHVRRDDGELWQVPCRSTLLAPDAFLSHCGNKTLVFADQAFQLGPPAAGHYLRNMTYAGGNALLLGAANRGRHYLEVLVQYTREQPIRAYKLDYLQTKQVFHTAKADSNFLIGVRGGILQLIDVLQGTEREIKGLNQHAKLEVVRSTGTHLIVAFGGKGFLFINMDSGAYVYAEGNWLGNNAIQSIAWLQMREPAGVRMVGIKLP